jgi:hypothetical protein
MLVRVPTVRTNFSKVDFVKSLIKAWYRNYNVPPTKPQIGVIFAQWALETGSGTYCWNNNVGNVKAVDSPNATIEYCALHGVWEIVNGKKVILSPEHPGAWFRSFRTLDEGVEFHMGLLRNRRYKIAWTAVEQGDPALFAKLLKQQGYYTAPEADYVRAMQYHFLRFMRDGLYETAMQQAAMEMYPVPTPIEYKPVDLITHPVQEDVVERKEPSEVVTTTRKPTILETVTSKLKNVMKLR